MATIRQDSLAAQIQGHYACDAAEANVFARELLKVRSQVFEIRYPELKAQRLIPKNTEMGPADEEYTYRVATEYGTVRPTSSYSRQTAPRADISMVEASPQRVRPLVNAYGYDIQEARVAAKTGNQLPMRKAAAARKAIAFEVNDILTYGRPAAGVGGLPGYGVAMSGIASLSGTLTTTLAAGAGGSNAWETMTSDEIVKHMNSMYSSMITNSKGVEIPNTMLLPLSLHEFAMHKRMGDGSDVTVLRHFEATHPGLAVEGWHALDAAPNSEFSGRRIICYRKDPDVLEYLLPIEFEQFAPQMEGLETITMCHARLGGCILYLPKAVNYGDVDAAP
jgi:hypothetical protein